MNEFEDEIVDVSQNKNVTEAPQTVKTLAILSIIGNAVWMLLILIGMMAIFSAASAFGGGYGGRIVGSMMGPLVIIFLLMIALNVLGLIAAVKMMKGKRGAYIMYAIVTGLWALIILLGSFNQPDMCQTMLLVLSSFSSIGFTIGFGVNMKDMPRG